MTDETATTGCLAMLLLAVALLVMLAGGFAFDRGNVVGYRRGYCEGRGGVEATVHDSIRCIQPPETVRTK